MYQVIYVITISKNFTRCALACLSESTGRVIAVTSAAAALVKIFKPCPAE